MKILVTGATGFIGAPLCRHLSAQDDVRALSRDVEKARRKLGEAVEVVALPRTPAAWAAAVRGCGAVVNLAGESIASGRWTEERKRELRESRLGVTRGLVEAIVATEQKPGVLISASAVGYYGPHGDEELDESAPPGTDFLARLCVEWESEARVAEAAGVRTVLLRIGVVLGEGGGALERMVVPFKLFIGGPVGSGRQWVSWIHRDDVIGLVDHALHNEPASGPLNATAPDARTMRDLSRTLGEVLGRPSWLPVPAFALKLALGEMANVLLGGQLVAPRAAEALGYRFAYPQLAPALRAILG